MDLLFFKYAKNELGHCFTNIIPVLLILSQVCPINAIDAQPAKYLEHNLPVNRHVKITRILIKLV